eukprot:TRINITY_DN3323_c0_g2_i1.p1 TRINITY_DN3323_c0_g2~~TRINITY_DN3323_c0_g2_i1.p1  ORF type:complete len:247 (+),score=51.01 TRINITY_DN3323_c0_g2_i1:238-978(+)
MSPVRSTRWWQRRQRAADQRAAAAAVAAALIIHSQLRRKRNKGRVVRRRRLNWELRRGELKSRRAFVQRYRFDQQTFQDVCDTIRDDIEPDPVRSKAASGNLSEPLTAELMLSATLRFCAGGAYQDIIDIHGIAESTLYDMLMKVWRAMRKHYPLQFDLEDDEMLEELERGFAGLSRTQGAVRGVVGALDGLAIRINCPTRRDTAKAASFKNRKGFFSMNCQAICDAKLRFRCVVQPGTVLMVAGG